MHVQCRGSGAHWAAGLGHSPAPRAPRDWGHSPPPQRRHRARSLPVPSGSTATGGRRGRLALSAKRGVIGGVSVQGGPGLYPVPALLPGWPGALQCATLPTATRGQHRLGKGLGLGPGTGNWGIPDTWTHPHGTHESGTYMPAHTCAESPWNPGVQDTWTPAPLEPRCPGCMHADTHGPCPTPPTPHSPQHVLWGLSPSHDNLAASHSHHCMPTDGIQDPAHGAIAAAYQDPEIRHIPEEIQPAASGCWSGPGWGLQELGATPQSV